VMEKEKFLVGLMGLGVNIEFEYDRYFAMIPTGTDPNAALTEGFFETAARQTPRPTKVAIVAADAQFSKNPILGVRANAAKNGIEVVSETKYRSRRQTSRRTCGRPSSPRRRSSSTART
jgi:branched-chain amino acid transport system substrate-binding protein